MTTEGLKLALRTERNEEQIKFKKNVMKRICETNFACIVWKRWAGLAQSV